MKMRALFVALSLISLFACNTSSKDPQGIEGLTRKARTETVGNILYSENFETSPIFSDITKQTSTTYGIMQSDSQYFEGSKSVRFELRESDAMVQSGTRAEVVYPITTSLERWYGFCLYFPSAYYQYDAKDEVIMQWHQGGGATPALCLRVKKDTLYARLMGTTWLKIGGTGGLPKDVWRQYTMHVKFASDSTGLLEIWSDGYLMVRHHGPNIYPVGSTYTMPIWKLGIYKSAWNDNETSSVSKRVLYYDRIKMGDSTCVDNDFLTQ